MPLILHQRRVRGAAEPQPDRGRLCPQLPAGAAKRRRAGQRNTGRCTGGGRRTLSLALISLPPRRPPPPPPGGPPPPPPPPPPHPRAGPTPIASWPSSGLRRTRSTNFAALARWHDPGKE